MITWPFAETRIIACRFTASSTSISMCGMFVLSSENSCCSENFGINFESLVIDARWKCLVSVSDDDGFDLIGMPCSSSTPETADSDSSSSGDSVSHIFCVDSSTFHTRSVWSRDHVTNSMSEWTYERFGRQAKSRMTSLWPRNEQIGALCLALFHNSKLFSPRPRFGTMTVTKPSANGWKVQNWNQIPWRSACVHCSLTVYLARHTGDEVVIIFSARRGFLMSKYFTVPSWLAVVRCVSCLWLQLIPCILRKNIIHEPSPLKSSTELKHTVPNVPWYTVLGMSPFASPRCADRHHVLWLVNSPTLGWNPLVLHRLKSTPWLVVIHRMLSHIRQIITHADGTQRHRWFLRIAQIPQMRERVDWAAGQ